MANVILRRAVSKHQGDFPTELVRRIARTNVKVFDGLHQDPPYTVEQYYERLANVKSVIMTAETNDVVIADCVAYEMGDCLYVWIIAVMSQARRKGLAKRFMDAIEITAREQGMVTVRTKVYNASRAMQALLINRSYNIVQVVPSTTDSEYNEVFFELRL